MRPPDPARQLRGEVYFDGDRQPAPVRLRHEHGPALLPQAQLLARHRPAPEHQLRDLAGKPGEGVGDLARTPFLVVIHVH